MEQLTFRFRVGTVPVVVHPSFWLLLLFVGLFSADRYPGYPELALAVAAIFGLSLLIHELGHAMAYKAFDHQPRAMLHGLGAATVGSRPLPPSEQIVVSYAGPLTQIVVVALPFLVLNAAWDAPFRLEVIMDGIVFFNLFWGIVNLLPALPLDGGNAAVAMSTLFHGNPRMRLIHQISIVVGVGGLVYGFVSGQTFFLFLWIFVIVINAIALRDPYAAAGFGIAPDPSYGSYDPPVRTKSPSKRKFRTDAQGKPAEVLAAAYDLLERHDPRAARDRVQPLLANKGKKRDRAHAAVIAAWSHLREGATQPAGELLGSVGEPVPGLDIARQMTSHARGELDLDGLAPSLSAALASLEARRDARQALEILVRRDEAVALATIMLSRMDLDGVLRVQQTLHDMGRRSLAQEVSGLLLADE